MRSAQAFLQHSCLMYLALLQKELHKLLMIVLFKKPMIEFKQVRVESFT
jgi:hypothetical protein